MVAGGIMTVGGVVSSSAIVTTLGAAAIVGGTYCLLEGKENGEKTKCAECENTYASD